MNAKSKQSTQTSWNYRGRNVEVPLSADIPVDYRPGCEMDYIVQEMLDRVNEWPGRKQRSITLTVDLSLKAIVVPARPTDERIWAKHVGHHAMNVQVSPFVRKVIQPTSQFTIELSGVAQRPKLIRAYPGIYIPPLPWQKSAEEGLGGIDTSLAFWQTHAYRFKETLVQPGSETKKSPHWFQRS